MVYNSFAWTSSFPGNLWVNVFFVLAFVFAIAAGIYQAPTTCPRRPACSPCVVNADTPLRRCAVQGRCEGRLIKRYPERFGEQVCRILLCRLAHTASLTARRPLRTRCEC